MNDEVSKLGQSDGDEPIEGRIVPDYAGPGGRDAWWEYLRDAYEPSYHYYVDGDGVHPGAEPEGEWKDIITAPGGWSVPKEQHYDTGNVYKAGKIQVSGDGVNWTNVATSGVTYEYSDRGMTYPADYAWLDEHIAMPRMERVTIETTFEDVSPELFSLLTGYDHPDAAPPVDPDKVKWPGR